MIYEPHDYQKYAINFIKENPIAAVLLDMGLGKTSITLTAINDLLFDSFDVRKVLVIAPLRVARDTWIAEVDKWDHLRHLICSVAVGTEAERKAALEKKAHIYIINRENVSWLIEESGIPFDFDMVVIDELSSFKNGKAKRFKSLLKVRPLVKRIVGLTGTPAGNGLMDLWAEFRVLDMGKRLGRFISNYRLNYFTPDKCNGQIVYSYKPLPFAEQAIYDAISDITISMKSTDHLKMPELVSTAYSTVMSDAETQTYEDFKSEYVMKLGKDKEITAANAAVLCGKLTQMVRFMTSSASAISSTTANWTLWRTSSKPPTENLFWWRTGISPTVTASKNGCTNCISRFHGWIPPRASADGTTASFPLPLSIRHLPDTG